MVLKRIGYDGKATGHGFHHTMSTILHEQSYNSAWIELQLAHADKNSISGIYTALRSNDEYREFQLFLAENPTEGDVIKDTGGSGRKPAMNQRGVF